MSCCFFRTKMFFSDDRVWYHSSALGADMLATVVGPCWGYFATFGTYALVGSLKWIVRALNSQG